MTQSDPAQPGSPQDANPGAAAQPGSSSSTPSPAPSGGGRGGLMAALAISVILLLVMSFLWAQEKQKGKDAGGASSEEVQELRNELAQAKADRDQALKDYRRLQSMPSGDEERVAELEEQVNQLRAERDFAESERSNAADFVIEVQRNLNNFKRTVQEADAKVAALEAELAALRGGGN